MKSHAKDVIAITLVILNARTAIFFISNLVQKIFSIGWLGRGVISFLTVFSLIADL
jgi:hypothetical protein